LPQILFFRIQTTKLMKNAKLLSSLPALLALAVFPFDAFGQRPQTEEELALWTIRRVQRIVDATDDALRQTEPIVDTLPLGEGQRHPRILRLWMEDGKAIKLTVSELDEEGEPAGESSFYFSGEDMFYASQPYAKFIFMHGKLEYWLNNEWEPTPVTPDLLDRRDEYLYDEANRYLTWIYREE
jgi:hypothetical protein